MKRIIIIFYLFPVILLGQNQLNKNSIEANKALFTDSVLVGQFHVRFTDKFDNEAKEKTIQGLNWLDNLIRTDAFIKDAKALKYKHTKLKNKVNTKCIAQIQTQKRFHAEEIYDLIINGDDGLGTKDDGIIDLYLDFDLTLSGNVLGSTTCGKITSGKNFFNNNSAETYAAHILHEYMHVLGFNHFLNNPFLRGLFFKKNDPPYQIGKLTRLLIKNND